MKTCADKDDVVSSPVGSQNAPVNRYRRETRPKHAAFNRTFMLGWRLSTSILCCTSTSFESLYKHTMCNRASVGLIPFYIQWRSWQNAGPENAGSNIRDENCKAALNSIAYRQGKIRYKNIDTVSIRGASFYATFFRCWILIFMIWGSGWQYDICSAAGDVTGCSVTSSFHYICISFFPVAAEEHDRTQP